MSILGNYAFVIYFMSSCEKQPCSFEEMKQPVKMSSWPFCYHVLCDKTQKEICKNISYRKNICNTDFVCVLRRKNICNTYGSYLHYRNLLKPALQPKPYVHKLL